MYSSNKRNFKPSAELIAKWKSWKAYKNGKAVIHENGKNVGKVGWLLRIKSGWDLRNCENLTYYDVWKLLQAVCDGQEINGKKLQAICPEAVYNPFQAVKEDEPVKKAVKGAESIVDNLF